MDLLVTLGRTLGFSLAAGVNLYATVALLGLATRFGWVDLPPQFDVFDHDLVIGLAVALYLVDFVADKVPWVDTLWDMVHTLVRPLGGALIAIASLGEASPGLQGLVALLGGSLAASSHVTKAGTRVMINTSPEPFSNWIVSFLEDLFVVSLGYLALQYPVAALVVVLATLVVMAIFAAAIYRALRSRFRSSPPPASAMGVPARRV